ncbi:RDD family protein [Acinetobacter sp. ACNIH1]|uniref:RDD family protein n=1 Tax=Acinetobacter sp. ACNIH1 TaxID=1636603 RepID=UPI000CDC4C99|nr:RDD family protein [Acinetobacter sp. ACNIH1]AUX89313.1 RDD family protein [Acinetobacter sp. ACNIH1]
MQIYLARNNQQAGPYTLEQLNQMLANQQVLLTDLAWHQGMTEWKALGELTQGKLIYQPEGYVAPEMLATPAYQAPQNANESSTDYLRARSSQNVAAKKELASIPSRILAKIVDLLLWLPATFILTAFFTPEQETQFAQLNQEFMNVMLSSDADPALAQQLQTQMFDMFSQQAWIATAIYLVIMLAIQAFLIAKSGQSIGKKLTKIKIVDAKTGEKTSLMRAFTIRSVFFIFLNIIFMPLSTIIDWAFGLGKKRQTVHDKLAKTQVVKQ